MPKIAIIVDYDIAAGQEEAFTRVISEHAKATLAEEPGCLRFEVIKPVTEDGAPIPNKLMLTELYADAAAFAAHKANPRMPSVRAATGPLLAASRLTIAEVL